MKVLASLIVLAATLVPRVAAHYRFTSLIVGGQNTGEFNYVRKYTNHNTPVTNVASNDMRCNAGGTSSGGAKTATVAAGSQIGFGLDQGIFHPGPTSVYLGKAPTTAAAWDGSGANWFKIWQVGATVNGGSVSWPSENKSSFTFSIPAATPPGEYLLRIENIGLHGAATSSGAQFYIACAQINVTGGGSGNPAKVSIPGHLAASDPGVMLNIYFPVPTKYVVPGPAVWTG